MLGFSFAFVLIAIVILVVIDTVTIRLIYENELIIQIDFLLFLLTLYPSRNKKRRKIKRFLDIKKSYYIANATRKALEYLFARSTVVVRDVNLAKYTNDPAKLALATQHSLNLASFAVTLLSTKTKNVILSDSSFYDDKRTAFNLSLSTTLFYLLSSLVIYLFTAYGHKRKRGRKNV